MKKKIRKNKLGQVTIFIILGVILVAVISLLFISIKKPKIILLDEENPQSYIDSCVKDSIEEAANMIMSQGGDIEPKGSIMYNGEDIVYLCYNTNYYKPCINQRPMLIKHIEDEITDYIGPNVNNCFNTLKNELGDKNYEVEMGESILITELQPEQIIVNINRDFKMTKGDKIKNFDNFKVGLISPIYDFAEIGNEIASQEAKYCYFNVNGFNSNYPEFEIRKDMISDSKIYKIGQRGSDLNFIFATRGCAMPAGF